MIDLLRIRKRKQSVVDGERSIDQARYLVIDTELTGLDERKDSIISIGAIRMIGGRIDLGDTFSQLVNPDARLTAETVVIHQITPSEVSEKPDIGTVLREFLEFCGDDTIVGHYVSIDLSFINRDMRRVFGRILKNPVVDTFALYEFMSRRSPSHGSFVSTPRDYTQLYDIAKTLGIAVSGAHNALMDAFITAQVFQRLIPMLMSVGVRSIGNLVKVTEKGGDRFRTTREMVSL